MLPSDQFNGPKEEKKKDLRTTSDTFCCVPRIILRKRGRIVLPPTAFTYDAMALALLPEGREKVI